MQHSSLPLFIVGGPWGTSAPLPLKKAQAKLEEYRKKYPDVEWSIVSFKEYFTKGHRACFGDNPLNL